MHTRTKHYHDCIRKPIIIPVNLAHQFADQWDVIQQLVFRFLYNTFLNFRTIKISFKNKKLPFIPWVVVISVLVIVNKNASHMEGEIYLSIYFDRWERRVRRYGSTMATRWHWEPPVWRAAEAWSNILQRRIPSQWIVLAVFVFQCHTF